MKQCESHSDGLSNNLYPLWYWNWSHTICPLFIQTCLMSSNVSVTPLCVAVLWLREAPSALTPSIERLRSFLSLRFPRTLGSSHCANNQRCT